MHWTAIENNCGELIWMYGDNSIDSINTPRVLDCSDTSWPLRRNSKILKDFTYILFCHIYAVDIDGVTLTDWVIYLLSCDFNT